MDAVSLAEHEDCYGESIRNGCVAGRFGVHSRLLHGGVVHDCVPIVDGFVTNAAYAVGKNTYSRTGAHLGIFSRVAAIGAAEMWKYPATGSAVDAGSLAAWRGR